MTCAAIPRKCARLRQFTWRDLETELLNPVDSDDIGIDARVERADGKLRIMLALSPETVTPGDPLRITELLVVTDARGYALGRTSEKLGIRVPAGQKAVRYDRTMQWMEGAARLRVIVRDTTSGRTGSLTIPLTNVAVR